MYKIKIVDGADEEIAHIIHRFNNAEPQWPKLTEDELEGENCYWWLAYLGTEPVGFAGMTPSRLYPNAGYFKRVRINPKHRGRSLQLRFFHALENKCRRVGWNMLISETTDTIYSANNFIRAGYTLFDPKERWAFQNSLYWAKSLI